MLLNILTGGFTVPSTVQYCEQGTCPVTVDLSLTVRQAARRIVISIFNMAAIRANALQNTQNGISGNGRRSFPGPVKYGITRPSDLPCSARNRCIKSWYAGSPILTGVNVMFGVNSGFLGRTFHEDGFEGRTSPEYHTWSVSMVFVVIPYTTLATMAHPQGSYSVTFVSQLLG